MRSELQMYELPLFPLNTVLFPGMPLPLHIFEERYKEMIADCIREIRELLRRIDAIDAMAAARIAGLAQ